MEWSISKCTCACLKRCKRSHACSQSAAFTVMLIGQFLHVGVALPVDWLRTEWRCCTLSQTQTFEWSIWNVKCSNATEFTKKLITLRLLTSWELSSESEEEWCLFFLWLLCFFLCLDFFSLGSFCSVAAEDSNYCSKDICSMHRHCVCQPCCHLGE